MRERRTMDADGLAHLLLLGRAGPGGGGTLLEMALLLLLAAAGRVLLSPGRHPWLARLASAASFRACGESTRVISHLRVSTAAFGLRDDTEDGSNNRLLQRAVMHRINLGGARWPVSHDTFLDRRSRALTGLSRHERPAAPGPRQPDSVLRRFSRVTLPPYDAWVEVGGGGGAGGRVRFKRCRTREAGDGGGATEAEVYYLRGTNGAIDDFVQSALLGYGEFLESDRDGSRHMYVPCRRPDGTLAYKQYPLSDGKTFASLHFPAKPAVLRLVDQFQRRQGKFAVEGFPKKLGFLLHGPPGTGKTSLIKALASHTGRHVVYVPLDRIRTNGELMSMMYDRRFPVDGGDECVELGLDQVVFVMEDVDAAGSTATRAAPAASAASARAAATATAAAAAAAGSPPTSAAEAAWAAADALNLAGILNALDGILDSPGRIVVMTTNHPDRLDPALIRPGRVNMSVHMGCIRPAEAAAMLAGYFGRASGSGSASASGSGSASGPVSGSCSGSASGSGCELGSCSGSASGSASASGPVSGSCSGSASGSASGSGCELSGLDLSGFDSTDVSPAALESLCGQHDCPREVLRACFPV